MKRATNRMEHKCILCEKDSLNLIMEVHDFPAAAQHMPTLKELKNDNGETLKLCQCRRCGLVQLDNEPVPYYRDVIRSGGFSKSMIDSRYDQFREFIDKCHLEGKKVVEVGCGAGEFIQVLSAFPVDGYGIEHDRHNVALGQKKGLNVQYGFAEDEDTVFPYAPYEAFISLNFIEHQPYPNDYLQAIYKNTTDDAYGYITVPDSLITINSSGYYDLVRDHIAYYTDETASLLIEINGFDILEKGNLDAYTLYYIVKKKSEIDSFKFQHIHDELAEIMYSTVDEVIKDGGRVAIWGASHQCFTILGTTSLKEKVDYVIDSATFKQDKYTPVSHIPIVAPDYFFDHKVDCILILAFFYEDEIAKTIRAKFGSDIQIICLHENGGVLGIGRLDDSVNMVWKEVL